MNHQTVCEVSIAQDSSAASLIIRTKSVKLRRVSQKDVHATDNVGDGFGDAVITGRRVTLAAFIQQLNKLSRKPTTQAVELTDPAVVVLLRYDLQPCM